MREVRLNGHKIEVFDDISELSIERFHEYSVSVLLPMRLRPRHVTSEEVRLLQSWESAVNCSFLPTNIRVCSLRDSDTIP